MNEEYDQIKTLIPTIIKSGVIALFFGISRVLFIEKYRTWGEWVLALLAAQAIGIPVGLALLGVTLAEGLKVSIICLCAFIAQDLITIIVEMTKQMRDNPFNFITRFKNAILGKSTSGVDNDNP